MEMKNMRKPTMKWTGRSGPFRTGALGLGTAVAVLAAGCDLGVSNPALIDEADLEIVEAIPAIVNGARYSYGLATTIQGAGGVYSVGAILTDELTHAGSWAPPRDISDGIPGNESPENQSHWGFSQRARWQAEDAIEKVSELVPSPGSNQWVALANLYAGFSNRLLGENFCQAVIDGSGVQPREVFLERAETFFTEAITVGTAAGRADYATAARAGRAQVRMHQGDWAGAVADAAQVPIEFVYSHIHSTNSGSENNGVFNWSGVGDGQYSVWGTPFAEWGTDSTGDVVSEGDPRVTYLSQNFIGGDGRRPYWFTEKYQRDTDIPLAKGTDMVLIRAEAELRAGSLGPAVDLINEVRDHHGLGDAAAADLDEGWQLLMKERGLELWLEGRRLGDLRRWAGDATTQGLLGTDFTWSVRGIIDAGDPETDPRVNVLDADPFCLRISTNEIFSNPNISANDVM
jgi:starch-binding outer membrane protein, SusD/RagB family